MADTTMHSNRYSSDVICVFGLLIRCPFESGRKGCPLSALRQSMSLEEKLNYAGSLGYSELQQIIEHHKKCFSKRIGPDVISKGK